MSELAELIDRLSREISECQPPEEAFPDDLPLGDIRELPEAFQHRSLCEYHVNELRKALKAGKPLEPVVVYRAGKAVYLIDGHHRMVAHRRESWQEAIPVRFFTGTPSEAVAEAGRLNARAKLPMSLQERQDLAWRLVTSGCFSKAQIEAAACVSNGQVANMRRVMKELGEDVSDYPSWTKAMAAARKTAKPWEEGDIEDWKQQEAERMAERLFKAFGPKLTRNPEVFAMALEEAFGEKVFALRNFLPQREDEEDEEEDHDF